MSMVKWTLPYPLIYLFMVGQGAIWTSIRMIVYTMSIGGDTMAMDGYLTIKEAAERLGCSDKTIRRKIQSGNLKAEKKNDVYGEQYFIPEDEINVAEQILEVVKVRKEYDVQELSIALAHYMQERESKIENKLDTIAQTLVDQIKELKNNNTQTLDRLEKQNQELKKSLEHEQEKHYIELDKKLTKWREDQQDKQLELRKNEEEKSKPWFKKIFK